MGKEAKYKNSADVYRKALKEKEKKRNKNERKRNREEMALRRNPRLLKEEYQQLSSLEITGRLDSKSRSRLEIVRSVWQEIEHQVEIEKKILASQRDGEYESDEYFRKKALRKNAAYHKSYSDNISEEENDDEDDNEQIDHSAPQNNSLSEETPANDNTRTLSNAESKLIPFPPLPPGPIPILPSLKPSDTGAGFLNKGFVPPVPPPFQSAPFTTPQCFVPLESSVSRPPDWLIHSLPFPLGLPPMPNNFMDRKSFVSPLNQPLNQTKLGGEATESFPKIPLPTKNVPYPSAPTFASSSISTSNSVPNSVSNSASNAVSNSGSSSWSSVKLFVPPQVIRSKQPSCSTNTIVSSISRVTALSTGLLRSNPGIVDENTQREMAVHQFVREVNEST